MEVPTQRIVEVTHANKVVRLDTLERLEVAYNPLVVAQNQHKIAAAHQNAAALATPTAGGTNGHNGCNGTSAASTAAAAATASGSKKGGNASSRLSQAPKVELPKVNIQVMSNYPVCLEDFTLPCNKVKYIEKNYDELDDEVEYDMDEEDTIWLKMVNERRLAEDANAVPVTQDQFELLMDRLEKESYFQQSTSIAASVAGASTNQSPSKTLNDSSSEDALCCICLDGECLNSNAILFCDMCNLAVHQECYGVPYIPEGQWLCRRCIQSPSTPVNCILCPNRYGAFKQTDDGLWAHVVCAIWIPEVHFANTVFLEPIIGIENIDKARWKLMCYICRKRNVGACIQCDKSNCYTAFHVTCAQQAGLYMNIQEEIVEVAEPPPSRKKKNMKNQANSSTSSIAEVRKCAYCDIHTPLDVLSPKTRRNYCSIGGGGGHQTGSNSAECEEAIKQAQKMRMKKARKILAERRNAPPVVSMPVLPKEKVQDIMDRVHVSNMAAFFQSLMNYWLMKRYSRNGVPLLRRLQHAPGLKKNVEHRSDSSHLSGAENKDGVEEGKTPEEDAHERFKQQLSENLSYCVKIRQDLEKVRLLLELIRKRERIKRDQVRIAEIITKYEINPLNGVFLQRLLEQLRSLDKNKVFYLPVDPADAPTYYDEIKNPMDFSKMQQKLNNQEYHTIGQFEQDFMLMINNCLEFNPKGTSFYKIAFKIREQSSSIIKQAKRLYDNLDLAAEFAHVVAESDAKLSETQAAAAAAAADTTLTNATTEAAPEAAQEEETPMDVSVPAEKAADEKPVEEPAANEEAIPVTKSVKTLRRRASMASSKAETANEASEDAPATANDDCASSTPSTTSKASTRRRASIAPGQVNTRGKRLSSISSSSSLATNLAVNDSTPSTSVPSPESTATAH